MIFTDNRFEQVKRGEKTQTRRMVYPSDSLGYDYWQESASTPLMNVIKGDPRPYVTTGRNGNIVMGWMVGKSYACQPGRGKRGEGRILITDIALDENVTTITPYDAKAEGFGEILHYVMGSSVPRIEFLKVWANMHDPKFKVTDTNALRQLVQFKQRAFEYPDRYRAWKITFVYIPPEGRL